MCGHKKAEGCEGADIMLANNSIFYASIELLHMNDAEMCVCKNLCDSIEMDVISREFIYKNKLESSRIKLE